jgi:hypothetical protein
VDVHIDGAAGVLVTVTVYAPVSGLLSPPVRFITQVNEIDKFSIFGGRLGYILPGERPAEHVRFLQNCLVFDSFRKLVAQGNDRNPQAAIRDSRLGGGRLFSKNPPGPFAREKRCVIIKQRKR